MKRPLCGGGGNRARVLVLYAGGTFGMRSAAGASPLLTPLQNVPAQELMEALQDYGRPEGIAWELEGLHDEEGRPMGPIDSSAVAPRHWICIAQCIHRRYDEFDGFVVIHGTDTLAYTASALSFLLVNLSKPVVLTGSQLPIFSPRTDARQNFLNALWVAGYSALGLPRVTEVVVAFGEKLLRGNRCRKASTSGWQGFESPNFPALGLLGETVRIHSELMRDPPAFSQTFRLVPQLDDRVLDLTLFPGIRADQVESLLSQTELRGVVLRAYGSGNAPDDPVLLRALRRATEAGKIVVIVSQCQEGLVDLGRYVSSHALLECGVASGFDLTPEAALTKLMWLLGQSSRTGDLAQPFPPGPRLDIKARFQEDHRGEQSFFQLDVPFAASLLTLTPPRYQPSDLERALLRLSGLPRGETLLQLDFSEGEVENSQGDALRVTAALPGDGEGTAVLDISPEVRRLLPGERPWRFHLSFSDERGPLPLPVAQLVLVSRR